MAVFKFTYTSEAVNTCMTFYAVIPQKKHIRSISTPELLLDSFAEIYPAVILLHDMHSSPEELIRKTRLECHAEKTGQILLLPQGYLSYYSDYIMRDDAPTPLNPATGQSGNFSEMRYGSYIIPELLDYAQLILPISAASSDISIGGVGMGGFGALKLGACHPDRIGAVISLDGHVDLQWMMDQNPSQKEQFLAIFGSLSAVGDNDLTTVYSSGKPLPRVFLSWREQEAYAPINRSFSSAIAGTTSCTSHPAETQNGWDYIDHALDSAMSWLRHPDKKER